jgi:hypothetical protein
MSRLKSRVNENAMAQTTSLLRSFGHFVRDLGHRTLGALQSASLGAWEEFAQFVFSAFWVLLILTYSCIVLLFLVLIFDFIF